MGEPRCWHAITGEIDTRRHFVEDHEMEFLRAAGEVWAVRSEDGVDYLVGTWRHGAWHPGLEARANREAQLLQQAGEPGAYAHRIPDPAAPWPHLRATTTRVEKAT